MSIEEFIRAIGITNTLVDGDDGSKVININSSDEFGRIYSKLENSPKLEIMYDNQVVTEEGSSLIYEAIDEPYLLNLIADWSGDVYSLVISKYEEQKEN